MLNSEHCQSPQCSNICPAEEGMKAPLDPDVRHPRFRWMELVSLLLEQPQLIPVLDSNLKLLFLSRQRLLRTPNVHPSFKQLFVQYDSQTCLKALSTVHDLSDVKMNQYKFMYRCFPLGKAVRLLISEGFFLYRNLINKSVSPQVEFNRLIHSWIDFVFTIHNVPAAAAARLRQAIVESVLINIEGRSHQIKGKKSADED